MNAEDKKRMDENVGCASAVVLFAVIMVMTGTLLFFINKFGPSWDARWDTRAVPEEHYPSVVAINAPVGGFVVEAIDKDASGVFIAKVHQGSFVMGDPTITTGSAVRVVRVWPSRYSASPATVLVKR